jgi:hypothetical protein
MNPEVGRIERCLTILGWKTMTFRWAAFFFLGIQFKMHLTDLLSFYQFSQAAKHLIELFGNLHVASIHNSFFF